MLERIIKESDVITSAVKTLNLQEEMEGVIVAVFGISEHTFDEEAYFNLVQHLSDSCDYAIMNMNTAALFAALLQIRYDYPFSKVAHLNQVIDRVRNSGFRSRVSNYLAYALLDEEEVDDKLGIAQDLFAEMQEKHGLLTGEDDYLASIYLASLDFPVKEITEIVESIYASLAAKGMKKGNALQNLSHHLAVLSGGEYENLVERVASVYKLCNTHKLKLNSSQYNLYGLIGYLINDYERFLSELLTSIDAYKSKLETKRLRTLQLNVIAIECIKNYAINSGTTMESYSDWQRRGIYMSLMMLLVNYLFRERLL